MAHRITVVDLPLRLLPSGGDAACYRPLAIGRTILRRYVEGGPWWVQVSLDGTLRPLLPPVAGLPCGSLASREAISLLTPGDTAGRIRRRSPRRQGALPGAAPPTGADIYGWSLLYQPPGMHGLAIVDPHDTIAELPAFFELPLELIDRADHLARRGVQSRALALLARPDDFEPPPHGGPSRNRFFPDIAACPPGHDIAS